MHSRTNLDKAQILRSFGWSEDQIAYELGTSPETARYWMTDTDPQPQGHRDIRRSYCPRCADGFLHHEAYAYLLGAYLGDGHITHGKRDVYVLWIFYDNKYPQLISYCTAAMETVFPIKVFKAKRPGSTAIKAASKHWPCIFPQHGPGHKHSRPIVLEPWQQEIADEQPEALIRGFIHSDGCRAINRIPKRRPDGGATHYEYPRYHFTNVSTDITGLFTDALDRLDILWKVHVSKREPRHRDAHIVSISRKDAVAQMDSFVGPKY